MNNKVIDLLKENNKIIAIKTDTVYGLICNANDKNAIRRIYDIKKREIAKPIGIFIKSIDELDKYVEGYTEDVYAIAKKYWPGALTIIFKKKKGVYDYLTCGKDTIGVRVPYDKELQDILNSVDFPLAQTSCNISGEAPYTDATAIREKFGANIDLIVDGGEVKEGIASTVIDVSSGSIKVLRKGEVLL